MKAVITTINEPTKAVKDLHEKLGDGLIIVGDLKTNDKLYEGYNYINPTKPPFSHYARKNFGYLEAMRLGADCILDVDDDTYPNSNWAIKTKETKASKSFGGGWFNVYEPMTINHIWPRGFPLSKVVSGKYSFGSKEPVVSSIQQCLVDGEPDVDAIYRLVINKKNEFKYDRSIYLEKNTWCPFNSQATWFFPDAFPLMYLPVTVNFRMCDIWRSFVAQKCLWELGQGVTFHSPPEFFQDRNKHDLMEDFADEVSGYLNNEKIADVLQNLKLGSDICKNLLSCYWALIYNGVISKSEIAYVIDWVNNYKAIINEKV